MIRPLRPYLSRLLTLAACLAFATAETRAEVFWTDWTEGVSGNPGSALGTLVIGATNVAVTYTGEIAFIQTDGGTNYWEPDEPYISATVPVAPPAADIIALSTATSKTVLFSEAVANPLFAVVSLNGNGYEFDRDFEILSFGQGYWGNGTLSKEVEEVQPGVFAYRLIGTGEPHGVIQFLGTFSSFSWTSLTNEHWNGFTIGVNGLAPPQAPEPSSIVLAGISGLAGLAFCWRRRRP